eukprot:TRINITY_DN14081_c0_g1_i7.p1 TRINITY_DN14081_c0_g1~~TRINITY_DN14081_c0_g1_i7.p1  ORF type:complete len:270 (-),score=127.26 TRINITY_DN14081_c0_g1_i7:596-1405(-)
MLKGKQADAILMKESELRRIKNSTKITTKKEEAEQRKRLEEQKEKEQEASELLKTKMKQFDQVRAKKMPLTEYQREELEKNQALLENAQKVIDEEMDDVKDMNKMIHYAKCVTIRDRQIEEAKRLEKQRKDDDLKMDTAMEIERLKVLKANEEQKILKGKQLMETVKEANRMAIEGKQKKIQEEKELDQQILKYNKEKAEREEKYQAELKRIHDEKEKETQRLRERQLKAINKQSEIDELKAKRAFEEGARLAREKELRECEDKVCDFA